jgi:hypothetical protein
VPAGSAAEISQSGASFTSHGYLDKVEAELLENLERVRTVSIFLE